MRCNRPISAVWLAGVLATTTACGLASPADPGEGVPGAQRIDVWLNDYEFPGFLDPLHAQAEEFERLHPEYDVVITAVDYLTLPEQVAEAARQGRHPDIAQYYYTSTQEALDAVAPDGSRLFTSVEAAIGGREEILGERIVLGDVVRAARDYYAVDGEVVAMPKNVSSPVMYANTTLLERAGVDSVPSTWDEIESACDALAQIPDGPASCISWPNQAWFFQQAVATQGGLIADNDNGHSGRATTVDLDSPQMLAWVTWWQRLAAAGDFVYSGLEQDFIGVTQAFLEQNAALILNSSQPAAFITEFATQSDFDVELTPWPANADVPYAGSVIGGDALWLAAGLDVGTQDAALALMQFLNNPDNAAAAHQTGGFAPLTSQSTTLLLEQGWFAQHPYRAVALDQLKDPRRLDADGRTTAPPLGPRLGDLAVIEDLMTEAMDDVLELGADPAGRFAQAEADAQAVLDAYNARQQQVVPTQQQVVPTQEPVVPTQEQLVPTQESVSLVGTESGT